MKTRCLFFLFFALMPTMSWAQAGTRSAAFAINERLGRGINMGNAFEAPSETAWDNPWQPEYFKIMADLGFNHVRIPIRWEPADRSMDTAPYTIEPSFLERIKLVVDEALKNKLQPIINMHHHDALFENPDGQKERFLAQWNQIASYFQSYSDSLLFEVLNEPHGNLTPAMWNTYFNDALTEIRKTNPTRCVLMGTADFGGLSGVQYLDLPEDENIIVSVHYYNPFQFTHQGAEWVGTEADAWLGTQWYDTEAERATVANEFSALQQFSDEQHVPVHVGEFGAYSKADMASRVRWTTYLARWFEEQGFSWAYWEFSAGFGIYNPQTETVLTDLANALLVNTMPDPTPIELTPVYTSDFSLGTDGWSFSTQSGASGTLSSAGGSLSVSITNGGTEGWHAQLVKNGISLIKDKMYRFSFQAQALANRSVSCYLGRASTPWTSYSGYLNADISTEWKDFSYTFTMAQASDPTARIVFDAGKVATGFNLRDVKVEMITIGPSSVGELKKPVHYFPNPVRDYLYINEDHLFQQVLVFDMQGRLVRRQSMGDVDMQGLLPGFYMVELRGNEGFSRIKVLKN